MNRRIVLLLLLIFSLFSLEAKAQRRGDMAIGKVNMHAVLLLHPAMADYDSEVNAFLVQRDAVSDQKAKNEHRANQEEINKLETQIRKIRVRITDEDNKFMKKMQGITSAYEESIADLATAPAALREVEYLKKKDKEEREYFARVALLNGEKEVIEKQLLKLTQFDLKDGYSTPEETSKRLDSIISETTSYIKRIADQKGISVVLNSGFKRLMRNYEGKGNNFVSNNNSLRAIVKGSTQATLNIDPNALRGYYESVNNLTISWLDNGGYIFKSAGNDLINSDIILGGYDLTGEVLTALYKAYKIDPNITQAIVNTAVSY